MLTEDPDALVATVNGLKDLCDAVDITDCNTAMSDENDSWNSRLSCIQKVRRECKVPILCKLPFSRQTIDDTIVKGKSLQEAGCEVIKTIP